MCNRFLNHQHSLTYKGLQWGWGTGEKALSVWLPAPLFVLKAVTLLTFWPWPDDTLKIMGWFAKAKKSQVIYRTFMMLMKYIDMLTARFGLIWSVLLIAMWQCFQLAIKAQSKCEFVCFKIKHWNHWTSHWKLLFSHLRTKNIQPSMQVQAILHIQHLPLVTEILQEYCVYSTTCGMLPLLTFYWSKAKKRIFLKCSFSIVSVKEYWVKRNIFSTVTFPKFTLHSQN